MNDLVERPYQRGMVQFAHDTKPLPERPDFRACGIGAEMGLGKTIAALLTIDESLYDYLDTTRWLVVAPRLVAQDTWPREIGRWLQFEHLTHRVIELEDLDLEPAVAIEVDGQQIEIPYSRWLADQKSKFPNWDDMPSGQRPKPHRCGLTFGERSDKAATKRRLLAYQESITIVSWDRLPWLAAALGKSWPYDGVVLDESDFAANSTSNMHKAAFHAIHRLDKVRRVLELAGKPAANGIEMMHGQMRLLDGGARLGSTKSDFQQAWMVPDKFDPRRGVVYSYKPRDDKQDEFQARVAQLWISLRSRDYLDLPPCVINPIRVTLGKKARELYDQLERDLVVTVGPDSTILAPSEGVLATKLRQLANGAVYDIGGAFHAVDDAKLDRLDEILASTPTPIVLAYNFQSDWERIVKRVKGAVHVKSPNALGRFRAGKVRLLGMHPQSGAFGLDGLQDVSSTAVWFGATYNARHWYQFNARLDRNGQRADRTVIHQILADDTIEDYVAGKALPGKLEESDVLLDAIKWRAKGKPG